MNQNLTSLFAVIQDNKILSVDTNLKSFVEALNKEYAGIRNYDWFYRAFKKDNHFSLSIDGKEYFFQKVL
ncbi:hypothetical protein Mucpa_4918 [Mucilaginibacter paludis DSM 18603]|uniref:Uncharacterized protein n=1 Tax=Mucilaginibacter paludis DSM 18603 TaxID=714943 RepID=H1Y7B5_9SPHI|nr:hypothetical protein Mucpa_4918 [Mucilaginibacter paludis DSM 18603]